MKLQFSLATLLFCVTVLAVVITVAIRCRVVESKAYVVRLPVGTKIIEAAGDHVTFARRPNATEISVRFASWGTPAVAATIGMLWTIRRLKSRRHTEPLDG